MRKKEVEKMGEMLFWIGMSLILLLASVGIGYRGWIMNLDGEPVGLIMIFIACYALVRAISLPWWIVWRRKYERSRRKLNEEIERARKHSEESSERLRRAMETAESRRTGQDAEQGKEEAR